MQQVTNYADDTILGSPADEIAFDVREAIEPHVCVSRQAVAVAGPESPSCARDQVVHVVEERCVTIDLVDCETIPIDVAGELEIGIWHVPWRAVLEPGSVEYVRRPDGWRAVRVVYRVMPEG